MRTTTLLSLLFLLVLCQCSTDTTARNLQTNSQTDTTLQEDEFPWGWFFAIGCPVGGCLGAIINACCQKGKATFGDILFGFFMGALIVTIIILLCYVWFKLNNSSWGETAIQTAETAHDIYEARASNNK